MQKIDSFFGPYRFLSNFYPSPIIYDKILFPTVEHAFQAQKSLNEVMRKQIALAKTPGEAKKMGRALDIRPDWELIKINVMKRCLEEKFKDPILRKLLLDTGDAELIEGNTWGDVFWGVCDGVGKNNLGKLLMKLRNKLKGK